MGSDYYALVGKEVVSLTKNEQSILEAYISGDALGYIAEFILLTGLREEEVENLQLNDWNMQSNTISIRKSKTKKEFELSLWFQEPPPSYILQSLKGVTSAALKACLLIPEVMPSNTVQSEDYAQESEIKLVLKP